MKKTKRIIWLIIVAMIAVGIICPIALEFGIFRNKVYSAIGNEDWASFLGSFIGGIIGGVGTLLAVYITVSETRDIQKSTDAKIEEDRRALELKDRKVFTDEIVCIIAKYITDISQYFSCGIIYSGLIRELEELNNELLKLQREKSLKLNEKKCLNLDNDIEKILRIEIEVEKIDVQVNILKEDIRVKSEKSKKYNINRVVAVECYYLLNIKLEGIVSAQKLLVKLKYIHQLSACQEGEVEYTTFDNEIEELQRITREFIENYISK